MTPSKILSIMMLLCGLYVAISSTVRKQCLCTFSLFWSLCKKHWGGRLMKMFVSTTHYVHSHSCHGHVCLTESKQLLLTLYYTLCPCGSRPPYIFSYLYHRVIFFFILFPSRHLYSAILPDDVGHDKCCKKTNTTTHCTLWPTCIIQYVAYIDTRKKSWFFD